MWYQIHEMQRAAIAPWRVAAELTQTAFQHPFVPAAYTKLGRSIAATAELFERTTRRFAKPTFGLDHTIINGRQVAVRDEVIDVKPFCHLRHFERDASRKDPKVLVVAPISGHHATLLRGTVEALLPHHDVYITDWVDARLIPLAAGRFDLNTYIDYVIEYLDYLGPDTHVIAVCQPAVPVLAAVALMNEDKHPARPASMTLMGGPIDTRAAPTVVTELAERRPLSWFERSVIATVPLQYPGAMRRVYPGFIQLTGFMQMNLDRHFGAHVRLFKHLVQGDDDSAEAHRTFYDEYLAVMDLPAEFYLQTVEEVFQKQSLARGELIHHGRPVTPASITDTALLTVEGEKDDISAPGQTIAAHRLCAGLNPDKHFNHLQKGVGHYGIFNGRRWREKIMPRVRAFIRAHDSRKLSPAPSLEESVGESLQPMPREALAAAGHPLDQGAAARRPTAGSPKPTAASA